MKLSILVSIDIFVKKNYMQLNDWREESCSMILMYFVERQAIVRNGYL